MRFLLDESVDVRVADALRSLAHDCLAIGHDFPSSLADRDVLTIAYRERRVLLTLDRHFGRLVFGEGMPHSGVLYLRLRDEPLDAVINRVQHVLERQADQLDRFIVVDARSVRVRES